MFFEFSAEDPYRQPHFCSKVIDGGGKRRSADAGEKNIPGTVFDRGGTYIVECREKFIQKGGDLWQTACSIGFQFIYDLP